MTGAMSVPVMAASLSRCFPRVPHQRRRLLRRREVRLLQRCLQVPAQRSRWQSYLGTLESGTLSPWTGLAVLAIWVAIALAAAAIFLRRRDARLTPLPNGRFPSVELATALPDRGTEDADAQVLGQAHGGRRHRARVAISYHRANRTVPGRSPQDPGGFRKGRRHHRRLPWGARSHRFRSTGPQRRGVYGSCPEHTTVMGPAS
jgi:hypothetical protein